jgi:nicotinate-nucleotide--dimethylbenzimidazole phosphoribosyltransferase
MLNIPVPDEAVRAKVARRLDAKTKPPRSLGRLEDLAAAVAAIQRTERPTVRKKAIVVMAADHGVAAAGVSAYPQEVTVQMLQNFAAGGAAICVLARQAGAEVVIVDMGCATPWKGHPAVLDRRIGKGTRDFTSGPAMTRDDAQRAIDAGIALAGELADREISLIGLGEMGIGNTTAASAMAAAFLGLAPEEVTGRGTGIDDSGYRRKLEAIRRGLAANRPDPADALDVLAKVGGFEIAGLAGVAIGAASRRVPVVTDGLIATAGALAAARLVPAVRGYLIPSHGSVEIGHRRMLEALDLKPLLDLEMRLGEGTGAVLAMHLVDASIRILDEMATFESAGVSGP